MRKDITTGLQRHMQTMQKWSRISRYVLFFILLCIVNPSLLLAQGTSILILNQSNKGFSEKLIDSIRNDLSKKNKLITIDKKSIRELPDLDSISSYDLILTLGNKPAEYLLKKAPKKPVLSLLITERAVKLLKKIHKPSHPWATLTLDQPIKRQLLLIKHLLGRNITVGTIFGPASKKNQKAIASAAKNIGIKLVHETTTITDQLISALKSLTSKSDVLLSIPDPIAFNKKNIRGILLLTYRKNIPVIGFSQSYVKAGALAATYSSHQQISRQAIEIINEFTNTRTLKSNNHKAKYFSVAINEKVARTLNIKTISPEKLTQLRNPGA